MASQTALAEQSCQQPQQLFGAGHGPPTGPAVLAAQLAALHAVVAAAPTSQIQLVTLGSGPAAAAAKS